MDSQTPVTMPHETDPSVLTTQLIWREIASLKELVVSDIRRIDKAIDLSHADLTRVPTEVQKAVSNLRELHDEKFASFQKQFSDRIISVDKRLEDLMLLINEKFIGIERQFKERDVRVEQTARDTKVAVDAALQAAEKAVGKQNEAFSQAIAKSEAATTKSIDQQAYSVGNSIRSLEDKINDLKERFTRSEGQGQGGKNLFGFIVGAVGLLIAIATLALLFYKK